MFSALRRHAEPVTVVDDELPGDPLCDFDETRTALARLVSAS